MQLAPARTCRLAAELRNVSVTYGADAAMVHAAKAVSFDVCRGEVLLLMGPSGSGKSTILQVLGCIRRPTAGILLLNGQTVHELLERELSQLRRERIGFVFQHCNLLSSLRAWENVALALEIRGMRGPDIERASRQMLDRLGLQHRADAYPQKLSGGEKQRVAIARAVVGNPDILLADEPTAALDSDSGGEVARMLSRIAREDGCAVVIVTHDPRITEIADRLAYMEDGALRWIQKDMQPQPCLSRRKTHEQDAHRLRGLDDHLTLRAAGSG